MNPFSETKSLGTLAAFSLGRDAGLVGASERGAVRGLEQSAVAQPLRLREQQSHHGCGRRRPTRSVPKPVGVIEVCGAAVVGRQVPPARVNLPARP